MAKSHKDIKRSREYWAFLNGVADRDGGGEEFDRNHAQVFADFLQEQGDARHILARNAVGFNHRYILTAAPHRGDAVPLYPHPMHPPVEGGLPDGRDRLYPAVPQYENGARLSENPVAAFRDNAHSDVTLHDHVHWDAERARAVHAPVLHWRAHIPKMVSSYAPSPHRPDTKVARTAVMTAPVTVEQLHDFIDQLPSAAQRKQWRETAHAIGWKRAATPAPERLARGDQPDPGHDTIVNEMRKPAGRTWAAMGALGDRLHDAGHPNAALATAAAERWNHPSIAEHPDIGSRAINPEIQKIGETAWRYPEKPKDEAHAQAMQPSTDHYSVHVYRPAAGDPHFDPTLVIRTFHRLHESGEQVPAPWPQPGSVPHHRGFSYYTPITSFADAIRLTRSLPDDVRRTILRNVQAARAGGTVNLPLRDRPERLARRAYRGKNVDGAAWMDPQGNIYELTGDQMHEEWLEDNHAAHDSLKGLDFRGKEEPNYQAFGKGWVRLVKSGTTMHAHNLFKPLTTNQKDSAILHAATNGADALQFTGAGYRGKELWSKRPMRFARNEGKTLGTGGAVRQAATDNHRAKLKVLHHLLREAKLTPAVVRRVLAPDRVGVKPSAMAVVKAAVSREHANYAAAWYQLMTSQPVTVFHPGEGDDQMHIIDSPHDEARVGDYLRRAGFRSFAVEGRPGGSRAYVTVSGDRPRVSIGNIVGGLNGRHSTVAGTATRIGSGTGADARADARSIISAFEQSVGYGSGGGDTDAPGPAKAGWQTA